MWLRGPRGEPKAVSRQRLVVRVSVDEPLEIRRSICLGQPSLREASNVFGRARPGSGGRGQ